LQYRSDSRHRCQRVAAFSASLVRAPVETERVTGVRLERSQCLPRRRRWKLSRRRESSVSGIATEGLLNRPVRRRRQEGGKSSTLITTSSRAAAGTEVSVTRIVVQSSQQPKSKMTNKLWEGLARSSPGEISADEGQVRLQLSLEKNLARPRDRGLRDCACRRGTVPGAI
jgi:hypothetical protein